MHFKVVTFPLGLGCHLVALCWPFLIVRACNLQVDLHSLPFPHQHHGPWRASPTPEAFTQPRELMGAHWPHCVPHYWYPSSHLPLEDISCLTLDLLTSLGLKRRQELGVPSVQVSSDQGQETWYKQKQVSWNQILCGGKTQIFSLKIHKRPKR